ncbi:hypothetical protein V6Z11_A12G163200 [Gossypium hirsutum]
MPRLSTTKTECRVGFSLGTTLSFLLIIGQVPLPIGRSRLL